ncbi:hypothetical protein JCM5296_006653 [Sporobolomyces johnsonii]
MASALRAAVDHPLYLPPTDRRPFHGDLPNSAILLTLSYLSALSLAYLSLSPHPYTRLNRTLRLVILPLSLVLVSKVYFTHKLANSEPFYETGVGAVAIFSAGRAVIMGLGLWGKAGRLRWIGWKWYTHRPVGYWESKEGKEELERFRAEVLRGTLPTPEDANYPAHSPLRRLWLANLFIIFPRHIGFSTARPPSVHRTPAHPLKHYYAKILFDGLILDLLVLAYGRHPLFTQFSLDSSLRPPILDPLSPSIPELPLYVRAPLHTFAFALAIKLGLDLGHSTVSFLAALVLPRVPFPSLNTLNPFFQADSVRAFWTSGWHDLFFVDFTLLVYGPVARLTKSRAVALVATFTYSGVLHAISLNAMGTGAEWINMVGLFAAQGVGIVLEELWTRWTGRKVRGWQGRVWALLWVGASGAVLTDIFLAHPTSSTVEGISQPPAMNDRASVGQENGAQDNYHHPSTASSVVPLYETYPFLAYMHAKPPPPTLQCSISPLFTPNSYDWVMAAAAAAGWASPAMPPHHPLSPSPPPQPYYPSYNTYVPSFSSYMQHPFSPTMHPALESTANLYHSHQLQHLPHGPLSPPFTPGLQSPFYHVDPAYSLASPSALATPLAFPAYGHGAYPFPFPSSSASPVPRRLSATSSAEESDDSSSRAFGGSSGLSASNAGPLAPESIVARLQEGAIFSYGYVKFFDLVKGYGFIIDQGMPELGGRDLFVHYTAIQGIKKGFRFLCASEWVEYNLTINSSGRMQLLNLYGFNGAPLKAVAAPAQAIAEAKISMGTGPRRKSGANAGAAEVGGGASGRVPRASLAASAAVPSTPELTQDLAVVKVTTPAGTRRKTNGGGGLVGVGIEVVGWAATHAPLRAAAAVKKTTSPRGRLIPGLVKTTASSSVVTPALST